MNREIELQTKIEYYQEKYYNGIAEISDAEFDELWDELTKINPNNPVLSKVGTDDVEGFKKDRHTIMAGSQHKVNDKAGLEKWLKSIKSEKVSISFKLDGHSIVLYYTNGKLEKALTRGDGTIGSDVYNNVIKMKGVHTQLKSNFSGAIRGEVLCLKDVKEKFFPEMKNCRNAVSVMHRLDGEGCENLTVIVYDVFPYNEEERFTTESQKNEFLKNENFVGCVIGQYEKNADEIISLRENIFGNLQDLNYDIDGLVIKSEEIDYNDLLNARPKTQVALKPTNERFSTTLIDISWENTNGTIVPVAILKPVFWKGAEIKRASLHNLAEIIRLGIQIGDEVYVERRNEIIPKVVGKVA